MDEGLLVVQEVGVGHPQLIGHSVIQGQVVGDLGVGQPFVPPRLLEVHGQGVVLQKDGETRGGRGLVRVQLEISHVKRFLIVYFFSRRVQAFSLETLSYAQKMDRCGSVLIFWNNCVFK